jgi:hypothetical protein
MPTGKRSKRFGSAPPAQAAQDEWQRKYNLKYRSGPIFGPVLLAAGHEGRPATGSGGIETALFLLHFRPSALGCIRQAGGIRVYRFSDCRSRFVALEVHCD